MALCNPVTVPKQKRIEKIDELYDLWRERPNIVKRFTDKHTGFNENASKEMFEHFLSERLELPFNADVPFNEGHFRRMKVEINFYNRALGGKFGNFVFMVPEGLSKKDPTSRKFYNSLNSILNHERTNISTIMSRSSKVSNLLFDAYMSEHKVGKIEGIFKGNKAIKELREIRDKLVDAGPNDPVFSEFAVKMEDFLKSDNGKIIRQFKELIEMNNQDFVDAKSPKVIEEYNPSVYKAVQESRKMLNEMGRVYVNGLQSFTQLIALKYTNQKNIGQAMRISPRAKMLIEEVQGYVANMNIYLNAKPGSKEWKAQEGYFPHMTFETIVEVKNKINRVVDSNKGNMETSIKDVIDTIRDSVNMNQLPDHIKGRTPSLNKHWEVDPTFVLNEYGHQAVKFNKLVHTQIEYLDALKSIPKNDDMQFVKGLKRFIEEEYTVFTEGTSHRADWVNNTVTVLSALQTARTMGLNITGGIKNALSAAHFYSRVGYGTLSNTIKEYNTGDFGSMVRRIEQKQGFLFTDAAKELYNEGLISKDDMATGDFVFDANTGKLMKGSTPVKDWLISAGEWTIDKALIFHRVTENSTRKWMFRTALYKKYQYLTDLGYEASKAETFATNFALKMVNGFAYEYARHAKAKVMRGEFRTVEEIGNQTIVRKLMSDAGSAISEVSFQLMHYPLSLVETQIHAGSGAFKALLARQGLSESADMQYFSRMAGTSLLVSLASVLTNTNLFNLFENETQERLTRVVDDLTQYDNPDKGTFGLISEATGPTISHLKYLMIVGGIIDLEHSNLNKIIFGNVDFSDDSDKLTDMYSAYQISTAWGVTKNKLWPAIKSGRGRDLFTHYLKLYPSSWTKKYHEQIFTKPKKKKRSNPNTSMNRDAALDILESMLRGG